jgi:hypothetical protein
MPPSSISEKSLKSYIVKAYQMGRVKIENRGGRLNLTVSNDADQKADKLKSKGVNLSSAVEDFINFLDSIQDPQNHNYYMVKYIKEFAKK